MAFFFQAIDIFLAGDNRLVFIEILNPWCSKGNIGWKDGHRAIHQVVRGDTGVTTSLGPESPDNG
jgi:hypothetical protein